MKPIDRKSKKDKCKHDIPQTTHKFPNFMAIRHPCTMMQRETGETKQQFNYDGNTKLRIPSNGIQLVSW